MKSYHDFHIYGYEVDSFERSINFKLVWPEENGKASIANLQFEGVFGYELKNDSMASIVDQFEEIPLEEFIKEYGANIYEAYKQYGAYGPWVHNIDKAEEELGKKGVKAVLLSSSLGLVGWVLAQTIGERNA